MIVLHFVKAGGFSLSSDPVAAVTMTAGIKMPGGCSSGMLGTTSIEHNERSSSLSDSTNALPA